MTLAVKTTPNFFVYPFIGLNIFIVYKRSTNTFELFRQNDGILLKTVELPEDFRNIDFEDFKELAKQNYSALINSFQQQ